MKKLLFSIACFLISIVFVFLAYHHISEGKYVSAGFNIACVFLWIASGCLWIWNYKLDKKRKARDLKFEETLQRISNQITNQEGKY